MNIGSVKADNYEGKNSRESIQYGYVKGDGLLGKTITAIHDLLRAELGYERRGDYKELFAIGRAWLELYTVLQAIEKAAK